MKVMDNDIIMHMVMPHLSGNTLTHKKFEELFGMLSSKEQYDVLDVLHRNQVELSGDYTDMPGDDSEEAWEAEGKEDHAGFSGLQYEVTESNRDLIKKIQEGDVQAKQDLCIKNHGLVQKWVYFYQHSFGNKMDFEDLEQAGMLGMIKAAEKFDLDMGTEFSTYAVHWIKQAIIREIQDNGFTIRIPVHRMEQIQKVMRLNSQFAQEKDNTKRMSMIAEETGMPVELVEECIRLYYQYIQTTSLDLPVGEDKESSLGEFIPYEEEVSVEDMAIQNVLRNKIEEVLETLPEKEQKILRLRFGLDGGEGQTLQQIAEGYGLSRERIRQVEAKALRRLRHPSRIKKLKDFLE